MSDPQVIVVGAGPAGMVLGLLLSHSGIRVTVLEQATAFAREFRGEVLQPGATRILGDLGLRSAFLR
jgi:monooxygenase